MNDFQKELELLKKSYDFKYLSTLNEFVIKKYIESFKCDTPFIAHQSFTNVTLNSSSLLSTLTCFAYNLMKPGEITGTLLPGATKTYFDTLNKQLETLHQHDLNKKLLPVKVRFQLLED